MVRYKIEVGNLYAVFVFFSVKRNAFEVIGMDSFIIEGNEFYDVLVLVVMSYV